MDKETKEKLDDLIRAVNELARREKKGSWYKELIHPISLTVAVILGIIALYQFATNPGVELNRKVYRIESRVAIVEDYMRNIHPETKDRIKDPFYMGSNTRGHKINSIRLVFPNFTVAPKLIDYDYQ